MRCFNTNTSITHPSKWLSIIPYQHTLSINPINTQFLIYHLPLRTQNPSNVLVGADSWSLVRKLLERSPHRRASLDQLREACGGVRPTPRAGGDVRRDHDHFRSKPKEKVVKVAKRYVPEFKQHQQHQHRPLHPGLHLHYHQHHHHYQGHHHNHYCQQFAVALPTLPLLPALPALPLLPLLPALPLLPLLPALPLLPTMPAFQECGWGDDYDGLGWLWG